MELLFSKLFFSKSCDLLAVAVKSTLAGVHAVTRVLQGLMFTFVINILSWTSRERSSFHWVSIDPFSPEVRMFHLCKCTKNNICSIDLTEAPVLQKRLNGSFPVPSLKIRTKVFPLSIIFLTNKRKEKCLCCITNSFLFTVQPSKEVAISWSLSLVARDFAIANSNF